MKEGDLVKFVGDANFYKGRVGVVCKLYSTHNVSLSGRMVPDSALVYYAGAESAGRAIPDGQGRTTGRHGRSGLHPMGLDELEVVDASR